VFIIETDGCLCNGPSPHQPRVSSCCLLLVTACSLVGFYYVDGRIDLLYECQELDSCKSTKLLAIGTYTIFRYMQMMTKQKVSGITMKLQVNNNVFAQYFFINVIHVLLYNAVAYVCTMYVWLFWNMTIAESSSKSFQFFQLHSRFASVIVACDICSSRENYHSHKPPWFSQSESVTALHSFNLTQIIIITMMLMIITSLLSHFLILFIFYDLSGSDSAFTSTRHAENIIQVSKRIKIDFD